jgi:hypothetical protein
MTVVLIACAYIAVLVFVVCLLTVAKRGDEAMGRAGEPAEPAPAVEPARHDLVLADVAAGFVGRFDRRAFAGEPAGGRMPPRA